MTGGNRAPEFVQTPGEARMSENETLQLIVEVDDRENDPVDVWVENVPPGAFFDPNTRTLWWTPGENAAGTYRDVTLVATDGINTTRHAFDLLVSQADRPPVIDVIAPFTLRQGDQWTYRIGASDPDGDRLLFTSSDLPAGATLDSREGTLRWTVGFDVPSTLSIPISVTAGGQSVDSQIDVEVINANGAPEL